MILILGGTKMARLLAETLCQKHKVIYSMKGSTKAAILPKDCEVKIGGFGGMKGLVAFLTKHNINLLIDASHPFAANISQNAIAACQQVGVHTVQYARRVWDIADAQEFKTAETLMAALPKDARILLTIGGQNIVPFLKLEQTVLARMIEPPKLDGKSLPINFKLLFSRPPYELDDEIELMQTHKITHLVCKNSGGETLATKLIAAQQLGVKTLLLTPPKSPHEVQLFNEAEVANYLYKRSLVSPS